MKRLSFTTHMETGYSIPTPAVLLLTILFVVLSTITLSQPVVMMDNVKMIMSSGANIIIDPKDGTTIQTTIKVSGTGNAQIISEEEINKIKIWTRDYMSATFIMNIPFYNSSGVIVKIKVTSTTPGSNDGYMIFATAPTTNNNKLISTAAYPSTVTNMNGISGSDNSANVVDRFWWVEVGGYTTKPVSTYNFYYSDADLGTITESDLQAQVWDGTKWVLPPVGGVFTATNNVGNVPSVNVGSCWTLVDKDTPLPIELMYFSATCDDNNINFIWSTASEQNSDRFIIEKSSDGINWYVIRQVNAAGNSNSILNYHVQYPKQLETFYRLTEIDYDGTYTRLDIIYVDCNDVIVSDYSIVVIPNPTKGNVGIEYKSKTVYNIQIFDCMGKIIFEKKNTNEVFHEVDLTNYLPGIYVTKIYSDEKIYTNKIIKL